MTKLTEEELKNPGDGKGQSVDTAKRVSSQIFLFERRLKFHPIFGREMAQLTVAPTGIVDTAIPVVSAPPAVIAAMAAAMAPQATTTATTIAVATTAPVVPCTCTGNSHYAGIIHNTVPNSPLVADITQTTEDGPWYAVTKGQFVGVFSLIAVSLKATTGVPNNSSKKFHVQQLALDYFNNILMLGLVEVVRA
ncbi:hypothetical protein PILCRDRAFT_9051 [Piloderma croceum F 1598]|uniref:Uncharacterized protein n=1 Tax=Piloderma croceum (strain F 1598) TaxID=765440 RepID=A0A0C3F8C4_PILCF|nr:hypothetical protein PILCRDRAFT_9051 [Piloderma croceum F 1598]